MPNSATYERTSLNLVDDLTGSRLEEGLPTGARPAPVPCYHCGTICSGNEHASAGKSFCCAGCRTVFELLHESGLGEFYRLGTSAGVRIQAPAREELFRYLDDPSIRERLVDYADEQLVRITFHLPAIHCIACVWLLENLFRLKPGLGRSQVNFPRKEVFLSFAPARVRLSEVVALLSSLGYEPDLRLSDLDGTQRRPADRRLWLQLGVAGFAFGNIMLFSIPSYFGLDSFSGTYFRKLFGFTSLVLAMPVVFYSATDYWRAAWRGLRQGLLTIEVPIAAGIAALFAQSTWEVVSGTGEGYFDSLAGLLFFLLSGRLFQQKTYDRLSFDRDYRSFFPLSVTRRREGGEEQVALAGLRVGDRLILRNGELVPADGRLVSGPALIDYSFVTGESEPVEKKPGDHLYAGGRQMGAEIEIETVKEVSQSYLTSLWNQEAFRKQRGETLHTLTNVYSYRFTRLVIAIAVGAALFWSFRDPSLALKAFTSVLIVACPCALALAAPFTLGTALRSLSRRGVHLKSTEVIETFARIDSVVFDKTGTLTAAGAGAVTLQGAPLSPAETRALGSLTRHSTHPCAVRIAGALDSAEPRDEIRSFLETTGRGIEGTVQGRPILMGSAGWLESRAIAVTPPPPGPGSVVHVAIDGRHRGCFTLASTLRPSADRLIRALSADYRLALLSGDNERERERFATLFGQADSLQFNQGPLHKLEFIKDLQASGRTVMMVGDGLNDAGALRQSDAGVAVVENISAFSPASDAIMAAGMVPRLHSILRFSRESVRIVRLSFLISTLYNVVGISIAARGLLSPVVCAVLMPLSSITVVAFACAATRWRGRRLLGDPAAAPDASLPRTNS